MRGLLNRPAIPLLLAMIGTAALLYSWIYKKDELSKATDEVNRLQRSQLVIDIDEVARDQWLIALNQEITKPAPNQEALAVAAHGALDGFMRWFSHMHMRVSESKEQYQLEIGVREAILDRAKQLAAANDYAALMGTLRQLSALSKSSQAIAKLDAQYFTRVAAAEARVDQIESRVRLWYILGTAALLLSSTLANISLDRTLRQIETITTRKAEKKK